MLHYAADAFTWPHNAFWPGTLLDHVRYERALHPVFAEFLRAEPAEGAACFDEASLHEAYASTEHSMETDCRFIFAACSSLLRQELERIPAEVVQPDSFAALNWTMDDFPLKAEAVV